MSTSNPTLASAAKAAILKASEEHKDDEHVVDPNSNNNYANHLSKSVAIHFLNADHVLPEFTKSSIGQDEDRLVKIGRNVQDLVQMAEDDKNGGGDDNDLEKGLKLLIEWSAVLASGKAKVPTVRFGKTELQMPIATLGCMRFQQTWAQNMTDPTTANPACQDNMKQTMKYAIQELGMNHIENARGYGSSEIQMGVILNELISSGQVKREDLLIQTKVSWGLSPQAFRETLDKSMSYLQVDYVDLFSFHGMAYDVAYENVFGKGEDSLIHIVKEYKKAGKIRHIGFSTHGRVSHIKKFIETDEFEYVNLHYHAFGSYTATGEGENGGNLDCVRLLKEKDMGVFIISPYDKGGRLYAPSKKLRSLTLPDLEPINYGSLFLWHHADFDEQNAPCHTFTVGAARPSDLDEPAVSAYLHGTKPEEMKQRVLAVKSRLEQAVIDTFDDQWFKTWHIGVPNSECMEDGPYQLGQIVGMYNQIKAWGMLDYCRDRYETFDNNQKKWDPKKSILDNVKSCPPWPFMPGFAPNPNADATLNMPDYRDMLGDVPVENKERVLEAIEFVFNYCSTASTEKGGLDIPEDWKEAYDMRPWTAFPERK